MHHNDLLAPTVIEGLKVRLTGEQLRQMLNERRDSNEAMRLKLVQIQSMDKESVPDYRLQRYESLIQRLDFLLDHIRDYDVYLLDGHDMPKRQ